MRLRLRPLRWVLRERSLVTGYHFLSALHVLEMAMEVNVADRLHGVNTPLE